jgi:heat shock protein HslJ
VGGKAGCNQYGATYSVAGEGLVVSDVFSTEMACEPDLMEQEAAFLDALGKVSMITFDEGGEMELRDAEFRQIYLRRK